jgi:hypothetical protein
VAVVALALWTFTAAVGVYLLITSTRTSSGEPGQDKPAGAPAAAAASLGGVAGAASMGGAAGTAPARPVRKRDRFDPPSLRESKDEPMPGMRAFAEFMHPALAVTGFGFWIAYTMVRDRLFAAIALGIMLGAIAAGLSWATSNARAAKRGKSDTLSFSPRVLTLHVVGAAVTLVLAALITARV